MPTEHKDAIALSGVLELWFMLYYVAVHLKKDLHSQFLYINVFGVLIIKSLFLPDK